MWNYIRLRFRIMFADRWFWLIYGLVLLVSVFLVITMQHQVEKGFEIPIAIIDQDQSPFSKQLMLAVEANPFIQVMDLPLAEAEQALKNQELEAVYIIHSGSYQEIQANRYKQLVTVQYLKDNNFVIMLSEIISEEMLSLVCRTMADQYYRQAQAEVSATEPLSYDRGFDKIDLDQQRDKYFVRVELSNQKTKPNQSWYNQNLIAEQVTVGVVYGLISFYMIYVGLFIGINRTRDQRLTITGMSVWRRKLADCVVLFSSGMAIGLPLSFIIGFQDDRIGLALRISGLFGLSFALTVYLLLHLIERESLYVGVGIGFVLVGSLLNGNFGWSVKSNRILNFIIRLLPQYYPIRVYFNQTFIKDLVYYGLTYSIIVFILCMWIEHLKLSGAAKS